MHLGFQRYEIGTAVTNNPIGARENLDETAALALEIGKLLMQAGSSGRHAENIAEKVAGALGAERIDVLVDCSFATLTVKCGTETATRACKLGPLGVNERLY